MGAAVKGQSGSVLNVLEQAPRRQIPAVRREEA